MVGECAACPHRSKGALVVISGEAWTAYCGKATFALQGLEDESVDAVISDPPYGTGAHSVAARLASPSSKYRQTGTKRHLPEIAGDAMLPDEWAEMMECVLAQCLRVAKPGASGLWFCDWRAYPMLMRIAGSVGWGVRGLLVWDKVGGRPSPNGFRAQTELILWTRKGKAPKREPAVYLPGVFRHTTPVRTHHMTEKPVALVRELIEICEPGGVVLDPFQGSGTTGVAAIQSGRRYVGIEVVQAYHEIACERLLKAESAA
jgi:site-specific DNA-methyltransferase (adenine-specific)